MSVAVRQVHLMCVPSRELELNRGAEAWVDKMKQKGKSCSKITPAEIKTIGTEDILYIHGHGLSPLGQKGKIEQSLFVSKDKAMSAKDFASYLQEKGLKKSKKIYI